MMAVSYTHLDVYKRQWLDGVIVDLDRMRIRRWRTGKHGRMMLRRLKPPKGCVQVRRRRMNGNKLISQKFFLKKLCPYVC